MPGEFYVATDNVPTLDAYLADSAVKSAMPPGKDFLPGTDSTLLGGKLYKAYYLVDRQADHHRRLSHRRPAQPVAARRHDRRVQAEQRRRPPLPQRDGQARRRLHGDHARRSRDGSSAGHSERDLARAARSRWAASRSPTRRIWRSCLRAGALPVPLRVAEVHSIGPSLGQDSINKGLRAGAHRGGARRDHHARVLPLLGHARRGRRWRSTCCTRWPRSPASTPCSRCPGIAGFVLSIGIAVDANVLIFERIREELARGKTVRTAIDEGFRHAMPAIVDSNVSTILTAAVLYQYGTGPVKGFAVTLIAGIVASLFTSIFVVRTFYIIWLNRSRGAQTLSI